MPQGGWSGGRSSMPQGGWSGGRSSMPQEGWSGGHSSMPQEGDSSELGLANEQTAVSHRACLCSALLGAAWQGMQTGSILCCITFPST